MADPTAIARAAEAIRRGGIACTPTETTYGLAADVRDPDALARLAALKGRDPSSPFGLIAPDASAARALAREWPPAADALARHWPGPLTLVVPARTGLAPEIVGPGGGVGVRVSSHPWAAALARAVGAVITATSANPAGLAPAVTANEAREYFGGRVDVYLDAGRSPASAPSTVVAIGKEGGIELLRRGAIDVGV